MFAEVSKIREGSGDIIDIYALVAFILYIHLLNWLSVSTKPLKQCSKPLRKSKLASGQYSY